MTVGSGVAAEFRLRSPRNEEIVDARWIFEDADSNSVTPPSPDKKVKNYKGACVAAGEFGVNVWAGEVASYSRLTIKGEITLKHHETGARRTAPVEAVVDFSHSWGGLAKAWYPYPADWDIPWVSPDTPTILQRKGRRALLLMWDLISQLPEEIRRTAGAIPIVRTRNTQSAHGKPDFDGAHVPFVHDAIQIGDHLVTALEDKPEVTNADIAFVSTVLHEMSHAVTYRKSAWDLHHTFAALRKYMRQPFLGPIGALPAGAAAVPVFLMAFLKEFVFAPPDFVSGYAAAADWELSAPWVKAAHAIHPTQSMFGIVNWLARIPQHGLFDLEPLRPTIVFGYGTWGRPMAGLRHRSSIDRATLLNLEAQILDLKRKIPGLKSDVLAETDPKRRVGKEKILATAEKQLQRKEIVFKNHFKISGFVSEYAAEDVLEDIAETYRWLVFGPKYLNQIPEGGGSGRLYAEISRDAPAIAQRHAYLVQEGVFPKTWAPIEVGRIYRGLESSPHLENLAFQL